MLIILIVLAIVIIAAVNGPDSGSDVPVSGQETSGESDSDYWENEPLETGGSEETSSSEVSSSEDDGYTLKVTVLDVGQGSSAVFESGGEYVVVDTAGRDYARIPVAYLKSAGTEAVKYMVLTHYDIDHIGAAIGIINNFSLEKVFCPEYTLDETYRTYTSLMSCLEKRNGLKTAPKPGDSYFFGNCRITFIGPLKDSYEEENSYSLSMIISDGENSLFIGGDCTKEAENEILEAGTDIDVDVYIVNHHGSAASSGEAFVRALSPAYSVISCGKDNAYGHPSGKVLKVLQEAGTQIYRTDTQGDIIFYFTDSGIRFERMN